MDKIALLTAEKLYEFATADKQCFRSLLLFFDKTPFLIKTNTFSLPILDTNTYLSNRIKF